MLTGGGCKEQRSTSDSIAQQRKCYTDDQAEDRQTTVDSELGVWTSNTNTVVDICGVITDEAVPTPLREEPETDDEQ